MSLTASMWTSVSGLLAHGEKMNVIGNNISNVNTVGFKGQRMDFQDFVYQYVGTANGVGQVGRGTSIGIVMNDFSQGSHETTTSATDIAINGNGFFKVKPKNNNESYYTRAGNFTFDRSGYLVDPHGYVLQGWAIDRQHQLGVSDTDSRSTSGIIGSGSPVDIKLDTFTCPPRHTNNITMPVNLKSSKPAEAAKDDHATDVNDPFFALLKTWDASQDPPLGSDMRAYQSTIEVYDEAGKMHKLSVYYDRVTNGTSGQSIAGNSTGESYWEFIVTMDPSEDVRDFNSTYDPTGKNPTNPNVPESLKGLLGAGTLTFNSSGELKDMSFFVPQSDSANTTDQWWTGAPGAETVDLSKWVAAPVSSDGFPMVAPNFSGTGGQQNPYKQEGSDTDYTRPNPNASERLIAIDLGIRLTQGTWTYETGPALPADTSLALDPTATSASGLPLAIGATTSVNIDGSLYLDTGGKIASGNWTQRTDSSGNPMNLYLLQDTRPGYPAQYYTTDASALPAGVSVLQTWPVIDAVPETGFVDSDGVTPTPAPKKNDGSLLFPGGTTLYNDGDPSTAVTVYKFLNGTGDTFYSTNAADPDAANAPQPGTTYYTALQENSLTVGEVDASGKPLTAKAPTELNVGGELFDPAKLPNPPYQMVNRKDASGNDIVLTSYTLNGKNFYTLDDPSTLPAGATNISSRTLQEPDPTVIYPKNTNGLVSAADVRNSKYHTSGMSGACEIQETTTTNYGDSFYEHNGLKQDGYTYGDLRYVNVSSDGVLSASYSNGVTLQLFQVTLHDFPSTQNLRREGGNLYTETRESGLASTGAAGTGTFGTTESYALEQSNVDLSREFVNMITTQRGFQANSKSITTVDTMLETVINMKR